MTTAQRTHLTATTALVLLWVLTLVMGVAVENGELGTVLDYPPAAVMTPFGVAGAVTAVRTRRAVGADGPGGRIHRRAARVRRTGCVDHARRARRTRRARRVHRRAVRARGTSLTGTRCAPAHTGAYPD